MHPFIICQVFDFQMCFKTDSSDFSQDKFLIQSRVSLGIEPPSSSSCITVPRNIDVDRFVISLAFQSNNSRLFERSAGPVISESPVTLDKLPFRLGIQICMEEEFAILPELCDGSGLSPVGKSIAIGQELGVTLGVCEQTIGCRV